MTQKQYRTIDSFLSHTRLGEWKVPKPERQLSWKEIKALYRTALILSQEKREHLSPESEYYRIEERIMVACLSWTKHGEKPLAVRIHDWLEDNIGIELLQKPFALRQELWYRAIGWEFSEWRFHISRQYFDGKQEALWKEEDKLNKQIEKAIDEELEAKEKGIEAIKLEAISKRIDDMMKESERIQRRDFALDKRGNAWLDDYYKQRALLHRWVQWRGLGLSARDIKFRLRRYVWLGTT